MEVVKYKYLDVHLDNRLDWRSNTDAFHKKGQSRLQTLKDIVFFGKLASFSVCSLL